MERGRVRPPVLSSAAVLLAVGLAVACSASTTGTRTSPSQSAAPKSVLFVQDAAGATLDLTAGTLTLAGANSEITYFADRPARSAGHVLTRDFVGRWSALFGADPPNAGLQAVDASGTAQPVVLELLGPPKLTAGTLTFKVKADGATAGTRQRSLRDVSLFIDGANPSGLPAATPGVAGGSATTHTVTVENLSSNYQSLVIYQNAAGVGYGGGRLQSLAWLTAMSWPKSIVTFTWSENYAIAWGPDGLLEPGVIFQAAQSVAADPASSTGNTFTFGQPGGPVSLSPAGGTAFSAPGTVLVISGADAPITGAAIAVAMNGSPAFAEAAPEPYETTVFKLGAPQYVLAAGIFQQGQVLDVPGISNPLPLAFPAGSNDLRVVLQAGGNWAVAPG